MPDERVKLSWDGPVAVITNDNPDKKNAFDDDMDLALFEILTELSGNTGRAGGRLAGRGLGLVLGP